MSRIDGGLREHVSAGYQDIERRLGEARRRQRRIALATGLGWGASAAGAVILAGALALGAGPGAWARWVRPGALILAAVALGAGVALVVRRMGGVRGGAARIAAAADAVAGGDPLFRSQLLSAIELTRERPALERSGSLSVALVDEHVARTAARARGVDLSGRIPGRPARRALSALAAVAALAVVAGIVAGPALERGVARLLFPARTPTAPPRLEPITGDIEVTYLYPAHTGRPPRKVPGSGGEISAPKGTEVRLATRSDRPVSAAQLVVEAGVGPEGRRTAALQVENRRDLSGSFVVEGGGSYRFQYLERGKPVVTGPPIPVTVEPDAFPEVRITAPAGEVEVPAGDRVHVEWTASDDFGLSDLSLVLKPPAGEEERRPLRALEGVRRASGGLDLELAPLRLAEGERLLYWLEVKDNDAVSGPKRAASATMVVKIYSEAEHHRKALEEARRLWEEMVRLLGDRLEQLPRGRPPEVSRAAQGLALDGRARDLHERLRDAAATLRKDRAAPREIPRALQNAAQGLRLREQLLSAARQTLSRTLQFGNPGDASTAARRVDELDEAMDRELENDVLYLEQLFDKRRAEDLVRMAKDLASRRRELASLVEKYRQAPGEEAKRQLLAEIARMRTRMQQMMAQMAELARGVSDGHMNAEAMAEVARGDDLSGGMDRVEEMLRKGDVDGALKELDAMGSRMQDMLASLERTAGAPDARTAELSRKMGEFRRELESVQKRQEEIAAETEKIRNEYRKGVAERLERSAPALRKLDALAKQAQDALRQSRSGSSPRSEDELTQSRERLDDLRRALAARDLEAALDASRRALPPMSRLPSSLEDDALVSERLPDPRRPPAAELREAARHAREALPPARQVREELERLFPDARTILPQGAQARMERLAGEEKELEGRAQRLQQALQEMAQEAPVFPPEAGQSLAEGRGHMRAAADELGRKDPQRGLGREREALDALGRLQKGLEEMAKRGSGGGGGGGFPFPFAEAGARPGEGAEGDPSREKVEIPAADASRAPEEFRRDLLEAMKQGTPEAYQGDVKRYYEELVR